MFKESFRELKVQDIKVIDYRRQKIDNVKSLSESIKFNGLTNPITVEERPNGDIELIAGFHRLQAHKMLSLHTIKAKILKYNNDVSDKDRLLSNTSIKQEENHVRQIFTPAEIAQDYLELENSYKNRFPNYSENPIKFIERYKDKQEAKKRTELLLTSAKNKNDVDLFEEQLKEIQKDINDIIPPSENIKNLFPSASKKDIDTAKKLAVCEKQNTGLIRNLTNDNIKKTTINKVIDELIKEENAQEYNHLNQDERKQFIEQLTNKSEIKKLELPVTEMQNGMFEIGKIKTHCVVLSDKLFMVPQDRYNCKIDVKNNKEFASVIKAFELEHFKCLVVIYDKKSFYNFIESFK